MTHYKDKESDMLIPSSVVEASSAKNSSIGHVSENIGGRGREIIVAAKFFF